jgi:hydroxymethylbilane synthase
VERLGLQSAITEYLPFDVMLPAPGQGALAIQCRAGDAATRALIASLDDPVARATTTAERAFLAALGGGCAAPIAALGEVSRTGAAERLHLRGLVASLDGGRVVRVSGDAAPQQALELARRLAREATALGAGALLC